jgi:dipeptidyl aminopeptidase/acylaminoacyl peptidase
MLFTRCSMPVTSPHAMALGALVLGAAVACNSRPTSPSAPQPAATPGRHEVSIPGAGVSIGGLLFRPQTAEARPAIVLLHGWLPPGSNGLLPSLEARAGRYADEGYVALMLAMRGWPPSGGEDDCGLRQPDDVTAAVQWLRTQPGVLGDRIGLVGFSQGGQVALLTGARDPRLRALVAYYPVTDVARWRLTTSHPDIPGYIAAVCEPDLVPRSPLFQAEHIQPPVLLVHGDADSRVPTEQSRLLHAARESRGLASDLLLVPGAQHGFTAAEEAFARPVVDRFLAGRLRE